MTRAELLQIAKPILFNTDMVRAILDGRKTVTRRVIKKNLIENKFNFVYQSQNIHLWDGKEKIKAPYNLGDILYVRETWGDYREHEDGGCGYYVYRADYPDGATTYQHTDGVICDLPKWHPSIHMPKEAARIFLKVKDVRVERLQYITVNEAMSEGITISEFNLPHTGVMVRFKKLWNSTIRKSDLALYGWDANPWVWVIEFERIVVKGVEDVNQKSKQRTPIQFEYNIRSYISGNA